MIITIAVIGLLVAARILLLAFCISRKVGLSTKLTDEEITKFIADDEARRVERAKLFGDNIYDICEERDRRFSNRA
mgnify:CR=1 FL=1